MSPTIEVREPEVQAPIQVWRPLQVPSSPRPTQSPRLFADVLLETTTLQGWRRSLATLLSLILQCSLLATLLIIPLIYTETLPSQQFLTFLVAPPPPPPPPPPASAAAAKVVQRIQSDIVDGSLRTPSRIPQKIRMIREDEEAPPATAFGGVGGGVPGGIPGGQAGGVIGGIISSTSSLSAIPKLAAPVAPKRIRISQGVTKGSLIRKIEPTYPPLAQAARIQGEVVLGAIISKTGEIENLALISGHPMLVPAAMAAVKQWRYRPFLLNNEPVEVDTTITLTFELSR
jgi:periplasmic protein TonB